MKEPLQFTLVTSLPTRLLQIPFRAMKNYMTNDDIDCLIESIKYYPSDADIEAILSEKKVWKGTVSLISKTLPGIESKLRKRLEAHHSKSLNNSGALFLEKRFGGRIGIGDKSAIDIERSNSLKVMKNRSISLNERVAKTLSNLTDTNSFNSLNIEKPQMVKTSEKSNENSLLRPKSPSHNLPSMNRINPFSSKLQDMRNVPTRFSRRYNFYTKIRKELSSSNHLIPSESYLPTTLNYKLLQTRPKENILKSSNKYANSIVGNKASVVEMNKGQIVKDQ